MPAVLPQTLISPGAQALGLTPQPRTPAGPIVYALISLFTTQNGSWDPQGRPYDVPDWARAAYLKPPSAPDYFDDAGGDHHLFARVEDEQGKPLAHFIRFWPAGSQVIDIRHTGDKKSGWANIPIWSSFSPERGEHGPWSWGPEGAQTVVSGGGLPNNHHVSSFAVWRRVTISEPSDPPTEPDPPINTQSWYTYLPDIFLLAALAWGEAEGEGERGQIAVMNVVANRARGAPGSPRWSPLFREVILQPGQFDGLRRLGTEPMDIPAEIYRLAHLAYSWQLADITNGATHFCHKDAQPYWRPLLSPRGQIGNHVFFRED